MTVGAATNSVFTAGEWRNAFIGALIVQGSFLALLAFAGNTRGALVKPKVAEVVEVPIAVQPVLDDLPLLKLGSKDAVKPRLPQMWQKREPVPVKRYEERSAPSAEAEKSIDKIPESKLADKDHQAPPEDAEIVKELEQVLDDPDDDTKAPDYDEEGAADGSVDGTETDPLKARQVDLYRSRIAAWFNGRFKQPTDAIQCEELRKLSALVSVQVGAGRRIAGFAISAPSGNATFDARVRSTLTALVGEQLPPPPPLYPDILGTTLSPRISGNCTMPTAPASPSPSPDAPEPAD